LNSLIKNNIYVNNNIMVYTLLHKKGIIIDKEPNISDIYYSNDYDKYFFIIKSIFDININLFIIIENINSNLIEKINKEFIIYDNIVDDTILLNDSTDLIYNYDGKRIFLLNTKNIFNSNNSIMPYGILH
jgi:hypothetical protein